MPTTINVTVTGLEEIARKLDQLSPKLNNDVIREALKDGGNVLLEEVKARTPMATEVPTQGSTALQPGQLKASMQTKVAVQPSTGKAQATIGPSKDVGYVARFIEYGYNLVKGKRKKGVTRNVIKHIPANPFMRDALEAKTTEVVNTVTDSLSKNLDKLVK